MVGDRAPEIAGGPATVPPGDIARGDIARGDSADDAVTVRRPAPVVNIANALTMLRLLLVPVFVAFLMVGDGHEVRWRWLAGVVFAVASITDRLDGHLARRYGLVTR